MHAIVEITTYPDDSKSTARVSVEGRIRLMVELIEDGQGTKAFSAAMAWIADNNLELAGWTHHVVERQGEQAVAVAPTARGTSPLCGAKRDALTCTLDAGHPGDHEAVELPAGALVRWT